MGWGGCGGGGGSTRRAGGGGGGGGGDGGGGDGGGGCDVGPAPRRAGLDYHIDGCLLNCVITLNASDEACYYATMLLCCYAAMLLCCYATMLCSLCY